MTQNKQYIEQHKNVTIKSKKESVSGKTGLNTQ
jgi:hypothetical protein